MDTTALGHLKVLTDSLYPLTDPEWTDFADIWKIFETKRKTILTQAGDTERYAYVVLEGVQRAYYVNDEGKEATLVFTYPFSFSGVADSFLLQAPSLCYFETLTASRFLRTDFAQMEALMRRHHNVERLIRIATNLALRGTIERQIELQCFSAEAKFRALLQRSPHLLHMIPHKYLASYLGIDPTNFSKFLSNIRI
jgi:CRP-like cAMP-binding protein